MLMPYSVVMRSLWYQIVVVECADELIDALVMAVLVMVELLFGPAEEAFGGGVIGRAAFAAHGSGQSVTLADGYLHRGQR